MGKPTSSMPSDEAVAALLEDTAAAWLRRPAATPTVQVQGASRGAPSGNSATGVLNAWQLEYPLVQSQSALEATAARALGATGGVRPPRPPHPPPPRPDVALARGTRTSLRSLGPCDLDVRVGVSVPAVLSRFGRVARTCVRSRLTPPPGRPKLMLKRDPAAAAAAAASRTSTAGSRPLGGPQRGAAGPRACSRAMGRSRRATATTRMTRQQREEADVSPRGQPRASSAVTRTRCRNASASSSPSAARPSTTSWSASPRRTSPATASSEAPRARRGLRSPVSLRRSRSPSRTRRAAPASNRTIAPRSRPPSPPKARALHVRLAPRWRPPLPRGSRSRERRPVVISKEEDPHLVYPSGGKTTLRQSTTMATHPGR